MHFSIHVAVSILLLVFVFPLSVQADGSRTLLDENGHRAFLEGGYGKDTAGIDRLNRFYVYAKAGEKIRLGSSALGVNQGDILFSSPDGFERSCLAEHAGANDPLAGKINSLEEELAGPAEKGGYTPCEVEVHEDNEGIWAITFLGPDPLSWKASVPISVSQPWVQAYDVYTIAAWDISVFDPLAVEKPGRVFAEHLPVTMNDDQAALFSTVYVLTHDGYVYRVGLSGLQAHSLTLFANRDGFIEADARAPLYRSVQLDWSNTANKGLPAGVTIDGPGGGLGANATVHKLFFSPPSPDLPERLFVEGRAVEFVQNPVVPAVPGSFGYNGSVGKPGTFSFTAAGSGRYRIDLDINNNGVWGDGEDVVLHGDAEPGLNFATWNGLGRSGEVVQAIEGGYQARIVFAAGEFHLPFIDVEGNPYGIVVRQVNGDSEAAPIIYYDDSSLPGGALESNKVQGVDSNTGGHAYVEGFGESAGIDTWTYATSEPAYLPGRFYSLNGDLRLVARAEDDIVSTGQNVQVTVSVSNDGPDATSGVRVKLHWPAAFFYQASNATSGTYDEEAGTWTIESVAVGEEQTLTITMRPSDAGSYPVYAQVIDMQGDDVDSAPGNLDIVLLNRPLEDDEDVAYIYVDPNPQIGIASRVVQQEGDASGFESVVEVLVENIGNTPLQDVQVVNLLPDALNGTDYDVVTLEAAAPLMANPLFDGKTELNMLQFAGSVLQPGEKGLITYTLKINPFSNVGPYSSTAEAYGLAPDDRVVKDLSTEGSLVDLNGNGFAGDPGEDLPMAIEVDQQPAIATALEVSGITGRASSFSARCQLVVENLGDVTLQDIEATLGLASVFGKNRYDIANLEVDGPLAVNAGYNGDDDINLLAPGAFRAGEKAVITFDLNAYVLVESSQYILQAIARGTSPAGIELFDASDSGTDPDPNGNGQGNDAGEADPTIISFNQNPVVGATLITDRVTGDLSGFSAAYTLRLKNLGDTPLYNLQALSDLEKTFPGAEISVTNLSAIYAFEVNPAFDGIQNKAMIASQDIPLFPGETFQLTFTVDVIPQTYFGPYEVSAAVRGESDQGIVTTDLSHSGPEPDPDGDGNPDEAAENITNLLRFAPNAAIGAALGVNSVSGDLEDFSIGYTIILENHSDIPLSALSVTQALDATFTDALVEVTEVSTESSLILNPLFDGNVHTELIGADSPGLGVGESASITVDINVSPREHFGPYALQAAVLAQTPFETTVADLSNGGLDTDPNGNGNPAEEGENVPALVLLDEQPAIGAVMSVAALEGDLESFTAKHVIKLGNLGDVPLRKIQAALDMASFYDQAEIRVLRHAVRGSIALNEAYDGQSEHNLLLPENSSLAVDDTARIEIDVLVKPNGNFGPYVANALVSAEGPGGTSVTDISDVGNVIDINQNGIANENSENRPLSVVPEMQPAIGIARAVSAFQEQADGSYLIQFDLLIRNIGDVPLSQLSLIEDLKSNYGDEDVQIESVTFSEGSPFTLNTNFDGLIDKDVFARTDKRLAPGEKAHVYLTVRTPPAVALEEFESRSKVSGIDPRGNTVEDWSNDGVVADPNGNGLANEEGENTPTLVRLGFEQAAGFASRVVHIEGDPTNYRASLEAVITNPTQRDLTDVQLTVDITGSVEPASFRIRNASLEGAETIGLHENLGGGLVIELIDPDESILPAGERVNVTIEAEISGLAGALPPTIRFGVDATTAGKTIAMQGGLLPVQVQTTTGEDGGLESNGNLAMLLAERSYRRQHELGNILEKHSTSFPLHMAGFNAVSGKGSLLHAETLDLIPNAGPGGSVAIVKTPDDLYGVTNATSVLATDYMLEQHRLAGLFATTSPAGETYEHSKNICDRLKGSRLAHVELVSIRGYPFVLSILNHGSGEVDYAISFITYKNGASHLIDSRFVQDDYEVGQIPGGEILNFQVWSYNPAYTIEIVEDIIERMEEGGRVDFVARENNIPQIPSTYVKESRYEKGTLFVMMKNTPGISQFQFTGEASRTESGEKEVFEHLAVVPEIYKDSAYVPVEIKSGSLFDALLYVTNDLNEDVDHVYMADGAWGQIVPENEETVVELFNVLNQQEYEAVEDRFIVERGLHFKGAVADSVTLFRNFKPGGHPINLSAYNYLTFTARGKGEARVQLESFADKARKSTEEFELSAEARAFTINLNELSVLTAGLTFESELATAISFVLGGSTPGNSEVELIVENIFFSQGRPVANEIGPETPEVYRLSQNYPNPFSTETAINFSLPEPASVNLTIYDVLGRKVKELVDDEYSPGQHTIRIENGYLSSGMYVYKLVANEHVLTKTMHVVR